MPEAIYQPAESSTLCCSFEMMVEHFCVKIKLEINQQMLNFIVSSQDPELL